LFLVIHIFKKQTKNNNKRKRNTYLDTRGMPSLPSWLLSWLLNKVTGCGGARTEPPNFDFVVAIVTGGWPSRVTCLPVIVYDFVMYLVWQHLSLQWL
jgi:hypothetical protein